MQQHTKKQWRKTFCHFVKTKASIALTEVLQEEQCLIISGPCGCGKSSLAFHIALQLEDTYGFDFMIISNPDDILRYASEDKKQLLLIDDVFGKFSVSNDDMFWWKRQSEFIQYLMTRNRNLRLLMTSRLHIYHLAENELEVKFCSFNLISKDLSLTVDDRKELGKCYLPDDIKLSEEVMLLYEFFPALCANFYDCKNENSIQYFTCPVEYIKTDIENISKASDLSYLALAVLIICGNNVNKDMFNQDNNKYDEMLKFVSKELDFEKKPSKKLLSKYFIALTDSYVLDKGSSFKCLHMNLFNTLAYCMGPSIILSILRYGTTSFITDRMQLEISSENYPKLTIVIPKSSQDVYFERMLLDLKAGFHNIFNSNQHKSPECRTLYIQYMTKHLKKKDLKTGTDGTTVLHVVSAEGFEDYVDFFLKINKPKFFVFKHIVNLKDNLGQTALHKACKKGHMTIAKLLLDNNAYVDTLDNDDRTALDMACSSELYATVELLLSRNATIRPKCTDLQSVLHVACKNNHFKIAQLLLENNANVNERDTHGHTPLHLACEEGHSEIVDLLLKYKIEKTVDIVDNKGRTALYLAADKNYLPIVQSLLDSKAKPDMHTDEIRFPLHCACQNGSLKIATLLITRNASVDIFDNKRCTPLYLACLNGHIEVAKLLLHYKADANKRNHFRNTPILAACQNNHNEIVKLLLDNNADINCKNKNMSTLLHVAVTNNNVDIILLLLKYGALVNEPDKNDQTPLLLACLKGYHIVAAELVKHGASINMANRNGETPLYISCKEGHVETVKMLLNAGANVNQDTNDGLTPLHMACEGEREHIVKVLLNAGVDLNMNFRDGSKQLDMVCKSQRKEIVSLVLKANAGVTPIDEKSPLYMACEDGNEAAVQDLLDECVNVNESNKDGITPLHLACKEGREQIVTLLIKAGVNVNQGDKNGTTPLQLACKEGNETIVKVLLHSVAYVNNSDNDGMTPLHVACKSGNKDIVTLLLNAGANVNKRDKKGDKPLQMVYMVDSEDTLNEESIVSDQVDVDDVKQINQINPINCKGERAEIAALLLDADTDPNNDDKKRENYADNIYSSN